MARKKAEPQIETQEQNALIEFPKLNLPAVTAITEEMNATFKTMFTRIEEDIASLPTDMTDPKNRAAVASFAYKISRTKTGLDEAAANVASDAKGIVDAVNAERRELKTTLDSLRDKARAPLDAWEDAQAKIKERADVALDCLRNRNDEGKDVSELEMLIDNLQNWKITEELYGEYTEAVTGAHLSAVEYLDNLLEKRRQYEAEQIELEQLRREKAEREAAEQAAKEAQERAEREKAEREREEQGRARIAQETEEKAIAVRATNYKSALESFARVIDRAATATSWQIVTFIETAEELEITDERYPSDKIGELSALRAETVAKLTDISVKRANEEVEAEKQRKREAEEAEARRIKAAQDQAAQAERDRIARDQADKEKADQERAADLAHRKKINSEAVAGLMKSTDLTQKQAQAVIIAIYKEQVPHVAINY